MRLLINLLIIFFLFGCANNSTQVWVADLDANIRPKSLEKIKPVKYRKEKNFFEDKKIFIFSPFVRTELTKFEEIQNFSKQLNKKKN